MIALVDLSTWHILLVVFAVGGAWYKLHSHGRMLEKHEAMDKELAGHVSEIKQDVAVIKTEISHISEKIQETSKKMG